MKSAKRQVKIGSRTTALLTTGLLAVVLCTGVSARASLAELQNPDSQSLLAQENQLSTGLQINSGSDLSSANPYTWLQAAPGVLSLNYNGGQPQQVLQLLGQSSVSTLSQANQQPQSSLQTLQQASISSSAVQQQTLQLLSQGDNASELVSLQQASAQQSLSLANQLQKPDNSLQQQQLSPVQSALNLANANQLNQLSTGLKINSAIDPSQLVVSTEDGLTIQLDGKSKGYKNTLGLNTDGLSVNNASLQALFTDPASQQMLQSPLTASDFTTVGHLTQSQALAFFQMAQACNGNNLLSLANDDSATEHFSTSVTALNNLNSPYLFISIHEKGSGDQNYNSAVLAVNIGASNVHALLAAPEPSLYLTLGGFLALAIWAKRRTDRVTVC